MPFFFWKFGRFLYFDCNSLAMEKRMRERKRKDGKFNENGNVIPLLAQKKMIRYLSKPI